VHCRACAQPLRSSLELSTDDARRLIDEVGALRAPVFVLTGGDPLKRPDIFDLVQYASTHGVRISLTPSATPLLTQDAIHKLKQCGLARLAISLMRLTLKFMTHSVEFPVPAIGHCAQSAGRVRLGFPFKSTPLSRDTTCSI
jgi:MoaA/NifB/PqqE/SkfB family radical SAM enzyme